MRPSAEAGQVEGHSEQLFPGCDPHALKGGPFPRCPGGTKIAWQGKSLQLRGNEFVA